MVDKYVALDPNVEPTCGSVVMLNGVTGTAVQRFHSDGKWHKAGRDGAYGYPYEFLFEGKSAPILIYAAPDED